MRKTNRERLAEAKLTKQPTVTLDIEGLFRRMLGGEFNPTQKEAAWCQEFAWAYMGPAGCAKTSTIASRALASCILYPGYRLLVCRHDYNDLLGTTMLRLEDMLRRISPSLLVDRNKSAPTRWWIRPAIEGPVSEITFMGLKDGLGSYDWHGAIVDEADECEHHRVTEIVGRLRSPVPDEVKAANPNGPEYPRFLALAFNPPDETHWLYKECTGLDERGRKVQDPSFKLFTPNPKENVRNLPPGYYEQMAARMPEDQRQRLVDGKWGIVFDGMPVYKQFAPKLHGIDDLAFKEDFGPLLYFWDFGRRRPVCLIAQFSFEGHLRFLHEVIGENEEIGAFAHRVKAETTQRFGIKGYEHEKLHFGDPAVQQKKDTGSTLAVLQQNGIEMRWQVSTIEEGVRRGRMLMEQLIGGQPALQISRRHCPYLIRTLGGGYRRDKHGLKPIKDGFYDNIADAFRYGIYNLYGHDAQVTNPFDVGAVASETRPQNHSVETIEYDPSRDEGFSP